MGLFSLIQDAIVDVKTAYYTEKIRSNLESIKRDYPDPEPVTDEEPDIVFQVEPFYQEEEEFEEEPEQEIEEEVVQEIEEVEPVQEPDPVEVKAVDPEPEIIPPEVPAIFDPVETTVVETVEEVKKDEKPKSQSKSPKQEKKKEPRKQKPKTEHTDSFELQMKSMEELLNGFRASVNESVTPPGGGIGSALKK